MTHVHVQTAADLTRRHRSTITRAIRSGRISAVFGADGRYLIDPAELERVFGKLAQPGVHARARTGMHEGGAHRPGSAGRTADKAGEAAALAREVDLLRDQLAWERTERERERHVFEEERRFLRGLIEQHTGQIRLLSPPPPPPRRWWFW